MDSVDIILLGRGTYEDLVRKWPSMNALALGKKINSTHKVVVTGNHPLEELAWGEFEAPEQLTGDDIEQQITDLKASDGGDIMILGSPVLVRALAEADLIDDYQIKLHPVVVNVGEHLFDDLKETKDFQLVDARALADGAVLVKYAPARAK
jgi:dihydrofolate reductase